MGTASTTIYQAAAELIKSFEGFRANPYWDVSRYSWGYGTPAPGPAGTITREQALHDLQLYVIRDYNYLKPMITRNLSVNQWAALLSFSYNLGPGNADNLVSNINSGNDAALFAQWMLYINSGGVPDDDLEQRRWNELQVWQS